MKNKIIAVSCYALALVLLIPGITQPILTIKAHVDKQQMLQLTVESLLNTEESGSFLEQMLQALIRSMELDGSIEVFETTRSIATTVLDLIDSGHWPVAMLIGLFAVVIPVIKILLVLTALAINTPMLKQRLVSINSALSKWSMSDVFVMALIVTFMAVNANEHAIDAVQMRAQLGVGFYFFTGYCLFAIAAGQFLEKLHDRTAVVYKA